jgi:hypothetical protein
MTESNGSQPSSRLLSLFVRLENDDGVSPLRWQPQLAVPKRGVAGLRLHPSFLLWFLHSSILLSSSVPSLLSFFSNWAWLAEVRDHHRRLPCVPHLDTPQSIVSSGPGRRPQPPFMYVGKTIPKQPQIGNTHHPPPPLLVGSTLRHRVSSPVDLLYSITSPVFALISATWVGPRLG